MRLFLFYLIGIGSRNCICTLMGQCAGRKKGQYYKETDC